MNMINHICFISNGYPSALEPYKYTFLDQLVSEIADLGVRCTVICPASITRYLGNTIPPLHSYRISKQGRKIEVSRPRYLSFSTRRLLCANTASWTLRTFTAATEHTLLRNHLNPDALYGHFIYPSGLAISLLGRKHAIPAFCAIGEGEPWTIEKLGVERTRKIMNGSPSLFAVSHKARRMLVEHGLGQENEIVVFPNGVDLFAFHPIDRPAMRNKYGFPQNVFIVAFVGKFSEGKGISRLVEALKGIQDIFTVFLGGGVCNTDPKTTLFKGQLPHSDIPSILNTADIFVLPTLIEGCSNAIIEALACGLPVVSSNYEFNDEILDEECSIRVDPLNVSEIRRAIMLLKNDKDKRERMSQAALLKASQLDLKKRARSILNWMESRIPSQKAVMTQEKDM